VVGWGASGHLLIGRKQICSIGNFKGWYFSFHADTNMSSGHLHVLGSDGESSEVEGGELSEVQGKSAAIVVEGEASSEVNGKSIKVDSESSKANSKSSEASSESSAAVGETGLGGCDLACFLEGCCCLVQSS
jgi:hypothetical protein